MSQVTYTYSVIQYVHDNVSGECLNVGVVLHCAKTGEVHFRASSSLRRLQYTFPGEAFNGLRASLVALEARLRAYFVAHGDKSLPDALGEVLLDDSCSLRTTPVRAGVSLSLAIAAEQLLERFVMRWVPHFDSVSITANREDKQRWASSRSIAASSNDPVWTFVSEHVAATGA